MSVKPDDFAPKDTAPPGSAGYDVMLADEKAARQVRLPRGRRGGDRPRGAVGAVGGPARHRGTTGPRAGEDYDRLVARWYAFPFHPPLPDSRAEQLRVLRAELSVHAEASR